MASNERIRKYLDAGTVLGQVSRGRAEEIVRELVNAGDIQRSQAQEWVDNLVERSRKTSEQVLELVRHEVATQLDKIDGKSLEAIANQVAEILKKSAEAGTQRHQGGHHAGREEGPGACASRPAGRPPGPASRRHQGDARAPHASTREAPPRRPRARRSAAHKATAKKATEGRKKSDKKAAS